MDKAIALKVSISQALAIAAGVPRYGDSEYTLTESDLASLAPDVRALLAESLDKGCVRVSSSTFSEPLALAAPSVSWDTVEPVLLERLAVVRKIRETAAADKEAAIQALLAIPEREWIYVIKTTDWEHGAQIAREDWRILDGAYGCYNRDAYKHQNDPRIAAVFERLAPELKQRRLQADADHKERVALARRSYEEAQERAVAESQLAVKKREAAVNQLRAFALGIDRLARPAKDGYDVTTAALDEIATEIRGQFADAFVLVAGSHEYENASWKERSAPRAPAFLALDRVTKHVDDVRCPRGWSRPGIPACVEIDISRIVRFTPASTRDEYDCEILGRQMTAIVVTIDVPAIEHGTRVVVFPAES